MHAVLSCQSLGLKMALIGTRGECLILGTLCRALKTLAFHAVDHRHLRDPLSGLLYLSTGLLALELQGSDLGSYDWASIFSGLPNLKQLRLQGIESPGLAVQIAYWSSSYMESS